MMLPRSVAEFRSYERTVDVKGLCEKGKASFWPKAAGLAKSRKPTKAPTGSHVSHLLPAKLKRVTPQVFYTAQILYPGPTGHLMTVTAIATVILYLGQRMPGPIGRADAVHDSRTMRYCLKTHFLISGSGRPLQICVSHHLLRMDLLNKSRQQPAHSTDHRQIRQGCITDPFPGLNPFSTSVHPPGSRKCRRSQPTTLFIRQCIAAARTGHTIGMVLLQKFPHGNSIGTNQMTFAGKYPPALSQPHTQTCLPVLRLAPPAVFVQIQQRGRSSRNTKNCLPALGSRKNSKRYRYHQQRHLPYWGDQFQPLFWMGLQHHLL